MSRIVQRGTTLALPQLGHSVHVEVSGLKPGRSYWYRFHAGEATSPVGRTRTLPDPESLPRELRFAFASCQHYEDGHYTAYERMAQDDLDLVLHLGDYIYEAPAKDNKVRRHTGPAKTRLLTLDDYRGRHALYRSDRHLQEMHRRCPWFVTWDDHEFDDNYAAGVSGNTADNPAEFLIRRAAAYQAYYEAMPLRTASMPHGPHMNLHRKASFGRLAEFLVLDTRQYRTDQPNGDNNKPLNAAALDPRNSLLGAEQRHWMDRSLIASQAHWNVLAQQVMMGMVAFPGTAKDPEPIYSMDQWPGAAHERMAIARFWSDRRIPNPIVLTGDIHSNWVNDLRIDDRKPEGPVVATEFVGTSISSGGNGKEASEDAARIQSMNPCVRFFNRERGYVRCTVTPQRWRSDYVAVEDISKPGGQSAVRKSFFVESGRPGALPV
jgi:alkaline phosphatase D